MGKWTGHSLLSTAHKDVNSVAIPAWESHGGHNQGRWFRPPQTTLSLKMLGGRSKLAPFSISTQCFMVAGWGAGASLARKLEKEAQAHSAILWRLL